jgi:hypothetical protein
MELQAAEWLAVVRRDYLEAYVRRGGAAIKFGVPADGQAGRDACAEELRAAALDAGFCFAAIDSRLAKIHLVDQLFFHVARQIDWDALTDGFLRRLFTAHRYRLPDDAPLTLERIADANALDPIELDYRVEGLLSENVYHNYALSYEFRVGMRRLCEARLKPEGPAGSMAEPLRQWLTGDLRTISALKQARIYKKIARHTARHMLASLAQWARLAGAAGLVLALDIGRYTEGARPPEPDGTLYYGGSATIDLYEVLRQFIDGTDELQYCFVLVLAAPSLLSDDRRGLNRYDALRLRISDEVHDRRRVNPLASLIRIARAGGVQSRPAETEA